jgi:hypothetical protein
LFDVLVGLPEEDEADDSSDSETDVDDDASDIQFHCQKKGLRVRASKSQKKGSAALAAAASASAGGGGDTATGASDSAEQPVRCASVHGEEAGSSETRTRRKQFEEEEEEEGDEEVGKLNRADAATAPSGTNQLKKTASVPYILPPVAIT